MLIALKVRAMVVARGRQVRVAGPRADACVAPSAGATERDGATHVLWIAALALALALCGCATMEESGVSGGEDPAATISYARSLTERGQTEQASAVLRLAALRAPESRALRAAYGKSLLALGRYAEASEVLANAHTPDNPDWSILSAQGVAADNLGDHGTARALYQRALNLNPGSPGVLTNLALSYAMTGNRAQAILILQDASMRPDADARVRQNLATMLVLEGREREAEQVFLQDLTPAQAKANIAWLRQGGNR